MWGFEWRVVKRYSKRFAEEKDWELQLCSKGSILKFINFCQKIEAIFHVLTKLALLSLVSMKGPLFLPFFSMSLLCALSNAIRLSKASVRSYKISFNIVPQYEYCKKKLQCKYAFGFRFKNNQVCDVIYGENCVSDRIVDLVHILFTFSVPRQMTFLFHIL